MVSVTAFGLALASEGPVGVPVVGEADGAQPQGRIGAGPVMAGERLGGLVAALASTALMQRHAQRELALAFSKLDVDRPPRRPAGATWAGA